MKVMLGSGARLPAILRSASRLPASFLPEWTSYTCYSSIGNRKYSDKYHRYGASFCNYLPLCDYVSQNQKYLLPRYGVMSAYYSESASSAASEPQKENQKKQTVFQKMKQLTKDYWHILLPVHIITSLGWVAIFYITIKNGVDVVKLLEYVNLSEKYLDMLKNSSAGNWALTYALYKVFTPLRYTVTVGGTTMAIRYLNKFGYLKAPELTARVKEKAQKIQFDKHAAEPKTKCSKQEYKTERNNDTPKT